MRTTLSCAIAALFLLASSPAQAGWDIFQSYVIVDLGAGSAYYAGGQNADGSTAFSELDFGTMDPTSDIFTLQGGEIKTWKDGSSNVCGGHVFYRLYATGSTPGSFASVQLDFAENLTGSNQKWNATSEDVAKQKKTAAAPATGSQPASMWHLHAATPWFTMDTITTPFK
jgi:hypothetical protein